MKNWQCLMINLEILVVKMSKNTFTLIMTKRNDTDQLESNRLSNVKTKIGVFRVKVLGVKHFLEF